MMTIRQHVKKNLQEGLVFALLTTVLLGLTLFSYIFGAGDLSFMDVWGWVYFLLSSLMHAGLFVAVPLLVVFMPLALAGVKNKVSIPILGVFYVFLLLVAVVNRYVFQLYHFHINGFVLGLLFSEGAGEIFVFSGWLYLKVALIFIGVCVAVAVLAYVAKLCCRHTTVRPPVLILSMALITLLSQSMHVYGAATLHPSILESDAFLPYYFPLSMNSALDKMGIIDRKKITTLKINENSAPLDYPQQELITEADHQDLNVVMIVIDSWSFRTMTEECMPHVWHFKEESEYFSNHLSSSNGTRGSIFGLLTGLPPYYWKSFEYSSLKPAFIQQLLSQNYAIQVYPSANFSSPPFDRILFKGIDINTTTEGISAYERDCRLTHNFLDDLPRFAAAGQPFYAFLFYDMAHAIDIPLEKNTHFQPAWAFTDYTRLNNRTDPEPFFNRYRNCIYQIDSLISMVLDAIERQGLMSNTVILITGDHGQEFNENKKNYWGHSGNYSPYQIQVPLILHYPGVQPQVYSHRTTHYDVVPTLMHQVLGVTNATADYSMGVYLQDSVDRGWHFVGNDINYAFITNDGHIIEKLGNGHVKVYDKDLNAVPDYKLSNKQLNDNLIQLNRFHKSR